MRSRVYVPLFWRIKEMKNKFVANIKKSFPIQGNSCIENAVRFIGETLPALGITKKFAQKAELLS